MTNKNTFEVEAHYTVKYTNREPVPIPDIIRSLKSAERILHRTSPFFEHAYKGVEVVEIKVYVANIESGSLVKDFVVKYVFKGEQNLADAKKVFDKIMSNNDSLKVVVAMGVGAVVTYGAMSANLTSSNPPTHIEAYNNNIINIGASAGFTANDISTILDSMKDKKGMAKESVDFISPAKLDNSASIEMSGITALTIDKDYVSEVPSEYSPPVPQERNDMYTNVDVTFYASDRDHLDKSWAGIVPRVIDKRVRFVLDEKLDPKSIHGRLNVKADITVYSRYNKKTKSYSPYEVLIRKVN